MRKNPQKITGIAVNREVGVAKNKKSSSNAALYL